MAAPARGKICAADAPADEPFAKSVKAAGAPDAPSWLQQRFKNREWDTLASCSLRVDKELGAGLDMEEGEFGYDIEGVEDNPGQDPAIRRGMTIISIAGERLSGLSEAELGEVFGKHFKDGSEVLLVHSDELQEATEKAAESEEMGANWELLWRPKADPDAEPAVIQIPVGRTGLMMDADDLSGFERELQQVGERHGLSVKPHMHAEGYMDSVELHGLPSKIAAARLQVVGALQSFREREGLANPDRAAEDTYGAEPAAKRRKEAAGEEDEDAGPCKLPEHVKDLRQFQYHDHTADIIVHSWGVDRKQSFEQAVVGMFSYMTDLDKIDIVRAVEVEASGHDLLDLLYHLLDEFLFIFGSEYHISRCVEILEFDEENLRIVARGYGDRMDLKKHEQGTEIKAITMHQMKILGPHGVLCEQGTFDKVAAGLGDIAIPSGFPHETYVLHDI